MFKLVKIPEELESFTEGFRDLFTKPSHRSFSHMIAATSVCDKSKTVYNLYDTMADDWGNKKARSTYDWFFNLCVSGMKMKWRSARQRSSLNLSI